MVKLVTVLVVLFGAIGCATAPRPDTETVGTLTAGSHVFRQPVHATTDLPTSVYIPAEDDSAKPVAGPVEMPAIAPKDSHGF